MKTSSAPFLLAIGCLLSVPSLQGDVIITEVADGNLTGQQPKFVEITNVGGSAYVFPVGGGIILQNNSATDYVVDWPLDGVTLQPGQSWVVNSLTPTGADPATFVAIFGKDADQYADVAFGNGDDRYILTDGTNFLDIFGVDGVDATPSGGAPAVWAYSDGYAYRKPGMTSGRGLTFNPEEWVFGGEGSLVAATDEEMITLAKTVLTAGRYDSGIVGNDWAGFSVDDSGNVDTGTWIGFINVAFGDWVWSFQLNGWWYLPENMVTSGGSWAYLLSTGGNYDPGITGSHWAGYPKDSSGYVDTGNWIGPINVIYGDWVWNLTFNTWWFLPENLVSAGGSWVYLIRF